MECSLWAFVVAFPGIQDDIAVLTAATFTSKNTILSGKIHTIYHSTSK